MNANEFTEALDAAVVQAHSESPRYHLGASQIGKECSRDIWYGWRWASSNVFPGRMLRLFQRGHEEEPKIYKWLKQMGCQIWSVDPEGNQYGFRSLGGHFAGSTDGIIKIPGDNTPMILELKTANDRSFKSTKEKGVRATKPEHYAQMMVYCQQLELTRALYLVVNKNDDEIYAEFVDYDPVEAEALWQKARGIIATNRPPAKLSNDPSFFKCKFCNHSDVCHNHGAAQVNCRTCKHASAEHDGWMCKKSLPEIRDQRGCDLHQYAPGMSDEIDMAFEAAMQRPKEFAAGVAEFVDDEISF